MTDPCTDVVGGPSTNLVALIGGEVANRRVVREVLELFVSHARAAEGHRTAAAGLAFDVAGEFRVRVVATDAEAGRELVLTLELHGPILALRHVRIADDAEIGERAGDRIADDRTESKAGEVCVEVAPITIDVV